MNTDILINVFVMGKDYLANDLHSFLFPWLWDKNDKSQAEGEESRGSKSMFKSFPGSGPKCAVP